MCALFIWPSCPDGRVSVGAVPPRVENGRVIPCRPRHDACFCEGALDTDDPRTIAAVRRMMRTARGEIREVRADRPAPVPEALSPAILETAILRNLRALWRAEEYDLL